MGRRDDQIGEEGRSKVDEVGRSELVEIRVVGCGNIGVEVGREVVGIECVADIKVSLGLFIGS